MREKDRFGPSFVFHIVTGITAGLPAATDAVLAQEAPNPAVNAIFTDFSKPGSPGCALGIYRDGKIIYAKGYGLANIEHNVPTTPRTVFDVASISKQFRAATILLFGNQGKLRPDDDVRKYILELPDYRKKITILHMINHTSGLRADQTLSIGGHKFTTNDGCYLHTTISEGSSQLG